MDTFNSEKVNQVKALLNAAEKIVVVAHKSPDGDSIGSSVGLFHYLKKKKKDVKICHPDPAPYFLQWMDGAEEILNIEEQKEKTIQKIEAADLIFCLDFNTMSRTGILADYLIKAKTDKIMIDHHLQPDLDEFSIVFSDPSACSTAQLVADFITAMGDDSLLDSQIGEALYCGIMTDTGSFRFPSVQAHTHQVVARLMEVGVKPFKIHEAVFDTNTVDKLRLNSFAINEKMQIIDQFKTAIIPLSYNELKRYNYKKGDTEGLVNVGLSIQGILKSIFLKEQDGIIKISFRSKGEDNPVNEMASKYFSGGGHKNAAGGKWEGSLSSAIDKIKEVLPEFD